MTVLGDIELVNPGQYAIPQFSTGPADVTFDLDLTRPSGAARAANAAGALGVALAGDNTAGHAATVISMIPHPAAQGVAAVLGVVSHFEAKSEAREAKRRATAVVIKNVRVVDNPNIPICYGLTAVAGNRAYIKIQNTAANAPAKDLIAGLDRSVFGDIGTASRTNEILVMQKVIGAGEIQTLSNIRVNDTPVEQGMTVGAFDESLNVIGICKVVVNRGAATSWDVTGARSSATFAGLSYVDVVCQMPYNDGGKININKRAVWRQGDGVPVTLFFVVGNKMRGIGDTGFLVEKDWQPNAVRSIADYLTSAHYGPRLADGRLDFASFKAAADACDVVWLGRGSAIWETPVGKSLEGIVLDADQVTGTYAANMVDTAQSWGWSSTRSGGLSSVQRRAVGGEDSGQFPIEVSGHYAPALIRRAEFNGNIDSTLTFYDALDELTNAVPGLLQFWGHDGKLKLSIPNPWQARADAPVRRITAAERVEGVNLSVMKPDVKDVLTSVLVTYNSRNHGFKPQTFLWPYAGSAEETALLRLSGGKRHQLEVRAPGIHNRLHAACIAKALCSYSNRRKVIDTVFWGLEGQAFEPGDVYEFEDLELNSETYIARVDSVETNFTTFQSNLMATEYYPSDYTPPLIQREPPPADNRAGRGQDRTSWEFVLEPGYGRIRAGENLLFSAYIKGFTSQTHVDSMSVRYEYEEEGGRDVLTFTPTTSPIESENFSTSVTVGVKAGAAVGATYFRAKMIAKVTETGYAEMEREYPSARVQVDVAPAADVDSGKALRVKLQPLGGGVYQTLTEDGDGTAKTYRYDVLPSGAAEVEGFPSGAADGEFVKVVDNTFAGDLVVAVTQSGASTSARSLLAYGGYDGPPSEGPESPGGPQP